MPTYDYQCDACGHAFELFQSMSAPLKRKCPDCGARKLQRLIGRGAGVIFKGSGFYETDYRSESYKSSEQAAESSTTAKSPADGAGTSESSTKAKPDESKSRSGESDRPAKTGSKDKSGKSTKTGDKPNKKVS